MVGFTLLGGDFFPRENAFAEQMTVWRDQDPKQSKKTGAYTFVPSRHDPSRQFWREFPAVFCEEGGGRRKPGVVRWEELLQSDQGRQLDRRRMVCFRISGMKYGDKDFFVNDSFSDSLTFQAELLEALKKPWRTKITTEIGNCERAAKIVGHLAQNLALAAGGGGDADSESARAQFYFRIDQPFRRWLQSIDPEMDDQDEKMAQWQEQAHQIAKELGRQMVEQAGAAAFVGHRIPDRNNKEKSYLYTAPKAYNSFLYELWNLYVKKDEGGTT